MPKLDLGGILQQRTDEQGNEPVFLVAPDEDASGHSRAPPEETREHFYIYPKIDPQVSQARRASPIGASRQAPCNVLLGPAAPHSLHRLHEQQGTQNVGSEAVGLSGIV